MSTNVLEEDTCKDILEELFSLSDIEIRKCFNGCTTPHEVLDKLSLAEIDKRLSAFASKISVDKKTESRKSDAKGALTEKVATVPEVVTLHWLLGQDEGYTDEEKAELLKDGIRLSAVVLWYDFRKETGWCYRQHKGTLHNFRIIREGMSNTLHKSLVLGDKIDFTPFVDETGRMGAKNVVRTGHVVPSSGRIVISDSLTLHPNEILRYGKSNSMYTFIDKSDGKITRQNIYDHGYTVQDFQYVYVLTKHRGEFRIYKKGSPVKGDGKVEDLDAFMRTLDRKVLSFGYTSSLEKTKAQRQEAREEALALKQKKDESVLLGSWYRVRFEAEMYKAGFSKETTKEALLRLGNIEKRIRKGSLSPTVESIMLNVKSLTRKAVKSPSADYKVAWFRGVVLSEVIRAGHTQKEARAILNKAGFNEYMQGKKWSVLQNDSPFKVAEKILASHG